MKRTNMKTLLIFVLLILLSITLLACKSRNREPIIFLPTNPDSGETTAEKELPEETESITAATVPETQTEATTMPTVPEKTEATAPASMEDALLIGDSRTVGLRDYAYMEGADYFANVGMSVYNVEDVSVPISSVGKVNLETLLQEKSYGKIYLMLGINEAGYNIDQTAEVYDRLVEKIQQLQPNAKIYLEANLHVSRHRSQNDNIYNNGVINRINSNIEKTAQKHGTFYLDVNTLFDDNDGNLRSEITGDDTHPYGKYYAQWADWLREQTSVLGKENAM